ncbi:MAG: hypothetical protein J5826_01860 [Bacteroidales bacterium]|nr:hypothetical protein [Bacteroidales bacterium]
MKGLLCWYLAKISNPFGSITWMLSLVFILPDPKDAMLPTNLMTINIVVSIVLAYLAAKFVANNYEDYFINL